MISFIEIFIDGFYVFCSTSCCLLVLTPCWMGHLRVRCVSLGVFRWQPLEYLLLFTWWCIIWTRWGWMDKKRVSLTPSLCRCFYSCACIDLQSSWRRKKPYVFIILLHFFFCQLTQTITVYQIKITHFAADLSACLSRQGKRLKSGRLGCSSRCEMSV